jgi:hypothetical protein
VSAGQYRVAGRCRIMACLYEAGRLDLGDAILEDVMATTRVSDGLIICVCGGFVVGCGCWRHTTKFDGTWVCILLAADMTVRTLSWARCSAPYT